MKRNGWHIQREGGGYILARNGAQRFDLAGQARFGTCDPYRLALQIRQDLWRALQNLRGFQPIVQATPENDAVVVTAGGQLLEKSPFPHFAHEIIVDLLANPNNRARWEHWARRPIGGHSR